MKLLDVGVVAKRLAIPVLVGAAVLVAAGFLAWAIEEHQGRLILRLIETEAARLKSELQAQLSTRMLAIRNLAGRGEQMPRDSAGMWQGEATRLLIANLQFRAIEWVEPSLEVRWAVPPTARTPALTLDPRDDELRIAELRRLEDRPEPAVSRTFVVSDGRRQVMICAPMFHQGQGAGFIIGVLRARDLLDAATKGTLQRGYTIAVYEEPYLIYGASWLKSGAESVWAMDRDLELGGHAWRVQVWPSEEMLAELRSPAPNALRGLGLVLAIMLGTAVYLAQSWRVRAFRAEAAGRGQEGDDLAAPDSFQEAEATASSAPSPEP